MTVSEVLLKGASVLSPRTDARLVCHVLLAFLMGVSKEQLLIRFDQIVDVSFVQRFFDFLDEIRDGKPLAYITGKKEFFGLDFFVDERVLVPRPETELLVEKVLSLVDRNFSGVVVDIGTGSGCIAISLAKYLSYARFFAVDISSDALDVAKKNADFHGVSHRIIFQQSDLLNTIIDQKIDILVANLPYVGTDQFRFVSSDVERFEPHQALFGGYDGLQLYKKLFQQVQIMFEKPLYLLGEFGFGQGESLRSLLNNFFDQKAEIFCDLADIERLFFVSSPSHAVSKLSILTQHQKK